MIQGCFRKIPFTTENNLSWLSVIGHPVVFIEILIYLRTWNLIKVIVFKRFQSCFDCVGRHNQNPTVPVNSYIIEMVRWTIQPDKALIFIKDSRRRPKNTIRRCLLTQKLQASPLFCLDRLKAFLRIIYHCKILRSWLNKPEFSKFCTIVVWNLTNSCLNGCMFSFIKKILGLQHTTTFVVLLQNVSILMVSQTCIWMQQCQTQVQFTKYRWCYI